MDARKVDAGRLSTAIRLAAAAHRDQMDKNGEPYILHPLRVMAKFKNVDCQIVAVLHDTVEDTEVALATINSLFGETIADAVDALTKREGEHYSTFIDRCASNDIARVVKIVDINDNTHPARMLRLKPADQIRLTEKYKRALEMLL